MHQRSQGMQGSRIERHAEEALRHLSKRAVSLLARILLVVLRTHQFPQVWKWSLSLNRGRIQNFSSYRPITLLDTIGKLFKKIPLAWILH